MKQETFNRVSVILFALVFIAGFVSLAFYGDIAKKEAPKDQYFICSVEKLADDYYSMVYTRTGNPTIRILRMNGRYSRFLTT